MSAAKKSDAGMYCLAVDTGGTFTDTVLGKDGEHVAQKGPSIPARPADGFITAGANPRSISTVGP